MNQLTLKIPMRREWGKAFILLGMSLYLMILVVSGNLSNYINVRFQWLSYVAAALFLLIGVWQVWLLVQRNKTASHNHDHDHDHDHAHHHHHHDHDHPSHTHSYVTWQGLALVFIPLFVGFFVPSKPLTADAITGSISMDSVSARTASAYVRPPEERNILEWLQEFNRVNNPAQFNGQTVNIEGFIYREPNMTDGQFMVARFTMSCCVADAFAIGMPVIDLEGAEMTEGSWVRIRGILRAQTFRGELLPVIEPESIEPIEAPQNPYLYS